MSDRSSAPTMQTRPDDPGMQRSISWTGGFWIASGVPALVLFSIGSIAATVGTISPLIWTVSVLIGLMQSFVFAEIAGLFPRKSGGASVYGAMAWAPYSKFVAPISVWCNWLAWSPVLTIGSGLAAGYVLTALFPADATINTWSVQLADLGVLKDGLELRFNATFLIAAGFMLLVFALQHGGILRAARVQTVVGIAVLVPLLVVGVVPLLTGDVASANFTPFTPLSGDWGLDGLTLIAGGLFLAAWSAYAFETSICYTSEFKDPAKDTPKAIFAAGLLCLLAYTLVPFTFQGALGVERLATDAIVNGDGVGRAMADMVGGGAIIGNLLIVMLILALLLTIMTTMAGSSRTLYQGSKDGWLPRYLGRTNDNGAPTRAMWTDLVFKPGPVADERLHLRPRLLDRLLHDLQLPEPQRGVDPPHGPRRHTSTLACADSDDRSGCRPRVVQRVAARVERQRLGTGRAGHRAGLRRTGHPGVLLSALRAGQGSIPRLDVRHRGRAR